MKKKLAILTIAVLGTSFGGMSVVNGQQGGVESTPVQSTFTTANMTSVIDDIEIPYEVLEYVQLTYDGHAVTKAEKVIRNGQDVYKLRVDRDDQINDNESIALLYSMTWKLIGNERAEAPPAPRIDPEPKKVEPTNNDKPTERQPAAEQKPVEKPKPEGGRGAMEAEPTETPNEQPAEESSEESTNTTEKPESTDEPNTEEQAAN